jgi:hypothetical protein
VPEAVIRLRVIRQGPRAGELLRAVAGQLGRDELDTDDTGLVMVRLDARGPKAWDTLRDALDVAGSDWREWLHLAPRPTS